jgi:hypothetical protein
MSSEINFNYLKTNSLTNLKIISKLQVGDKLLYHDNQFNIDKWFYLQPLIRWYYSESRSSTLKHLNEFIENVFHLIEIIYSSEMGTLENNYYIPVSKQPVFNEENSSLLINIVNELQNAVNGINNLKQTYNNDITIVSSLDILIEKIQVRIKKVHNSLSINKKS